MARTTRARFAQTLGPNLCMMLKLLTSPTSLLHGFNPLFQGTHIEPVDKSLTRLTTRKFPVPNPAPSSPTSTFEIPLRPQFRT
jgi:hypothetical protein